MSNSVVDEDALVRQFLPVARRVTRVMCKALPRGVSRDGVYAAACEGLLVAIRTHDPARGSSLGTWCEIKARHAVLDWVRAENGYRDNSPEGRKKFYSAKVSLDATNAATGVPVRNTVVGDDGLSVGRDLVASDLVGWAARGLLPAERAAVAGIFYEGRTQAEVAAALGCSESRVSLLLRDALALLRERLEELTRREDTPPSKREAAEQRALERIQKHGATIDRIDGSVAVTIGPPHPLFNHPVICWGDDLADAAENLEQTIRQHQGLPLLRR